MRIQGKHVHILCVATPSIYNEAIQALFHSCYSLGAYRITIERAFKKPIEQPFSHDVNIVMKAQRAFHPDILPAHAFNILFQSEQYTKLREFNSMPHSEPWGLILDVFQQNYERFSIYQDNIRYLPIGYSMAYYYNPIKTFITDAKCPQDCYMFGARTKYRSKIWNEIIMPNTKDSVFGNDHHFHTKYDNILFSKINLFIPAWEPYFIPNMHLMQMLANQKFVLVISDTPQLFYPYEPGRHFWVTNTVDAKQDIKWFLDHESCRCGFAQQSFDDIHTNHTFTKYLDMALHGME